MSSNLKIDLDSESERLRNDMMNANTLEEVLNIEEKIKELESKTNKFVESLDNNMEIEQPKFLTTSDYTEIYNNGGVFNRTHWADAGYPEYFKITGFTETIGEGGPTDPTYNKDTHFRTLPNETSDKKIKGIIFGFSVQKIGFFSFTGLKSLETVIIDDDGSRTNIYPNAFKGSGVKTLKIGSKVSTIQDSAFQECQLENLIIPSRCTIISENAFADISTLKSVIFPSSISKIGNNIFKGCGNLKHISFPRDRDIRFISAITPRFLKEYYDANRTEFYRDKGKQVIKFENGKNKLTNGNSTSTIFGTEVKLYHTENVLNGTSINNFIISYQVTMYVIGEFIYDLVASSGNKIDIKSGGKLEILVDGIFRNNSYIINSGEIINNGTFHNIESTKNNNIITNYNKIINYKSFENSGTINNNKEIINYLTFKNSGTINNNNLFVTSKTTVIGGTINTNEIIYPANSINIIDGETKTYSELRIDSNEIFFNENIKTIVINEGGTLNVDEYISIKNLTITGTLKISNSGKITLTSENFFSNTGTLYNQGTFETESSKITNSGDIINEGDFNCVKMINTGKITNGTPNVFFNDFINKNITVILELVNQGQIKNYGKITTKNIGLQSGEVRNEYTGIITNVTATKTGGILASYSKITKLEVDKWLYTLIVNNYIKNSVLHFDLQLSQKALNDITIDYETLDTGTASDFTDKSSDEVTIIKGKSTAKVKIPINKNIIDNFDKTIDVKFSGNIKEDVTTTNTFSSDDFNVTSYKSTVDSENKYYIIKIESGETTIEYYQNDKIYGRRELLPNNTFKIYQIDENGTETETSKSLVDDNTLTRILEVSKKLKTKITDLDEKQKKASTNITEGKAEEQARNKKENDDTSEAVEKEIKFALSTNNDFCQINSNDKTYINTSEILNKKSINLGPKNNNVDSVDYPLDYSLLSKVKFTIDSNTTETIKYPRFKFGDGDWIYDDDTNKYFKDFKYFYLKLKQETQAVGAGTTKTVNTNILEFANWDKIFSVTDENVIEIEHAYKVEYKDKKNATDTERIGLIGITLIKKEDMPPAIQIEKPNKMKIGDNSLFISVNDIDNENSDIKLSVENLNNDLGTLTFKERKSDKFEYNYNLTKNNKDHAMIRMSVTSNGKTVTKTVKLEIEDKPPVIRLDTIYNIKKNEVARLTNFTVGDPDNTEIDINITENPKYGEFFTIYSGDNRAFSYRNTSIPKGISANRFTDTFKLQAQSGRSTSEEKTVTIIITINEDYFPNDPTEKSYYTTLTFDRTVKSGIIPYQQVVLTNKAGGAEKRELRMSTNLATYNATDKKYKAHPTLDSVEVDDNTRGRKRGNATTVRYVSYKQIIDGYGIDRVKLPVDIGTNLGALFPGNMVKYLNEPIPTWVGKTKQPSFAVSYGRNTDIPDNADVTTLYDIIQFQKNYNGIQPQDWIKYVENDTQRNADPDLRAANIITSPTVFFKSNVVTGLTLKPDGVNNDDDVRWYEFDANGPRYSWYDLRSHYAIIRHRGVIFEGGFTVWSQGRSFTINSPSLTPGTQSAPRQDGANFEEWNKPANEIKKPRALRDQMPSELYDYIFYRAFMAGRRIEVGKDSVEDEWKFGMDYANEWVKWVPGKNGENEVTVHGTTYSGGYYQFRAIGNYVVDYTRNVPGLGGVQVISVLQTATKWYDHRVYYPATKPDGNNQSPKEVNPLVNYEREKQTKQKVLRAKKAQDIVGKATPLLLFNQDYDLNSYENYLSFARKRNSGQKMGIKKVNSPYNFTEIS